MSERRPNILFLMTDQHRADCLGCYGNSVIKTPNFDGLAQRGVRFTRAYSSTPSCTPARAAILTGLSPWRHGMLGYGRVAESYPFEMVRAMADAGYYTAAIGKLHFHPQRNYHGFHEALIDESGRVQSPGFVNDYRQWFKKQSPDLDPGITGIGFNDYRSWPYKLPEELHPTRWTAAASVDFIYNYNRPEPLFLNISFARPHSPYDPPARFMEMYNKEDMPPPYVGDWAEKYAPIGDPNDFVRWRGNMGLDQALTSRCGYYGSVSFIDEQIGRIMNALEAKGMLENTLILFTSDHGDMLGDHHLWRKTYAYESSARIPMMISWPERMGINAERGSEMHQLVELRDILPTFLDAVGAQIPDCLDGRSMLDLIRGDTNGWRDVLDLEHDICYDAENHWTALTDGRWKYIYSAYNGSQQLFDMDNDPGEEHDLSADPIYSENLKQWRVRMVEHLSERGQRYVKNGDLVIRPEGDLYSQNYPNPT
ncbi:MAG: arylsulfatase [Armatimonadota bacterium]|nr:arylsulfatase [Armatimonadota bacterium]